MQTKNLTHDGSIAMKDMCSFCGNRLVYYKNGRKKEMKTHINIQQTPQIHYFCDMDCKMKWIYKIQNTKI